jgi:hypothetical protein
LTEERKEQEIEQEQWDYDQDEEEDYDEDAWARWQHAEEHTEQAQDNSSKDSSER